MGGEGEGKTVCVTGASGFIASWLVKLLLQRGYTVKATVRDPNDPKKTEHLLALEGAKERLHLFKAELCDEGSFDSVVDGCEGVFHTASPFFLSSDEHHKSQLVDSAVNGTLNVLKSCAKVSSIKRVVLTSSMAAVASTGKPLTPDVLVDETWFSDPDVCEKSKHWYQLSKTLAEKAAWKFAEENGIDLVAINPGLVIGPLLQPTVNLSVDFIIDIVNGRQLSPFNRFVDVRDVAFSHILAFEVPSASGRYCMVERTADYSEVLKILDELYPDLHLSEKFKDKDVGTLLKVSKEKAISLGVNFIPLQVSLKDTVESLKEKGFLSI
ncbi:hypothetical protein SLA2020_386860 [Shorea laevis]